MCEADRYGFGVSFRDLGEMIRSNDPNLEHAPNPNFLIDQYRSRENQDKHQKIRGVLVSSGAIAGIVIGAVLTGTETNEELGIGLIATSAVVGSSVDVVIHKRSSSGTESNSRRLIQ